MGVAVTLRQQNRQLERLILELEWTTLLLRERLARFRRQMRERQSTAGRSKRQKALELVCAARDREYARAVFGATSAEDESGD
jgi:hypothetical protein